MLAMPSEIPACPEGSRQRRLAVQLADVIPGAATIRVALTDPRQTWPHLHAVVKDEDGTTLEVGRTAARIAGRWITRVWPEVDWTRPHTFRLSDATLIRSDLLAAGRDH
ncbi:transcriptional regulator [Streptomyces bauhiniae]|uniref:transcriptional regulator n=1 Tax=Streptomyces bauhiniae TaxID=2340725 RepID=UPI0035DD6107